MAEGVHDFDEAFEKLTTAIKQQAQSGSGRISLDVSIGTPFQSTFAPTSSHALHEFARIFEGADSATIFLRLDGPAIYLVVSTVLQFPACSLLNKMVYFFMEILSHYAEDQNVRLALQTNWNLDGPLLEAELQKPMQHILSRLVPRLKALLFESERDYRIKRLIASLIMSICRNNARGWQVLMTAQERQLFGTLFSQVDDYATRLLIADIIRHLLANNHDVHEIWEQSSEEVMDFPASQELDSKTISKILDTMSALDARQAFSGDSKNRVFHVADVNISDIHYHSAQSDAILTLGDHLVLLIPDCNEGCTSFATYEIPLTPEMILEDCQTPRKQTSHIRLSWKDQQGNIISRGKKERVKDIRLQFVHPSGQSSFCNAFYAAFELQMQRLWPAPSQESIRTAQRPRRVVMNDTDLPLTPHKVEEDRHARYKRGADQNLASPFTNGLEQLSSESMVENMSVASDVFAPSWDGDPKSKRPQTEFSNRLEAGSKPHTTLALPAIEPGSNDGGRMRDEEDSFPLKACGRSETVQETAARQHITIPTNPVLNLPLHQHNDDDYTFFLSTASRVNVSPDRRILTAGNHCAQGISNSESPGQKDSHKLPQLGRNLTGMARTVARRLSPSRGVRLVHSVLVSEGEPQVVASTANAETLKTVAGDPIPTGPARMERKDDSKPKRGGGSTKLERRKRSNVVSNDVDWDADLRTHEPANKKQKSELKKTEKVKVKKPLRDITNTNRVSAPPSGAINPGKATSKSKGAGKEQLVQTVAPTTSVRRSRRTTTNEAKSYAESSASEESTTSEKSVQEGHVHKAKLHKHAASMGAEGYKPREGKIQQWQNSPSNLVELSSSTASPARVPKSGLKAVTVIEVASSDRGDEFDDLLDDGPSGASTVMRQNNHPATEIQITEDKESEFQEDSYPREDMKPEVQSVGADKRFATKLSDMIGRTPTSITPFGSPRQFVYNINNARSSRYRAGRPNPFWTALATAEDSPNFGAVRTITTSQSQQQPLGLEPVNNASIANNSLLEDRPARFPIPLKYSQHQTNLQAADNESAAPVHVQHSAAIRKSSDTGNEAMSGQSGLAPSSELLTKTGESPRESLHVPKEQDSRQPNICPTDTVSRQEHESGLEVTTRLLVQATNQLATEAGHMSEKSDIRAALPGNNIPPKEPVVGENASMIDMSDLADVTDHRSSASKRDHKRQALQNQHATYEDRRKLLKVPSKVRQLSAAVSEKTKIIHFGSVGPQNQGSPSRSKAANLQHPPVIQPSRSPNIVQDQEELPTRNSTAQTNAPAEDQMVFQCVDNESARGPVQDASEIVSHPGGHQFEGLCGVDSSHFEVDEGPGSVPQAPVVPSISGGTAKNSDLSDRRHDSHAQLLQNSLESFHIPKTLLVEDVEIDLVPVDRNPTSSKDGSNLIPSVHIPSTHTTPAADYHFANSEDVRDSMPRALTTSESKQPTESTHLRRLRPRNMMLAPTQKRDGGLSSVEPQHTERSPSLALNAVARKIFETGKRSNALREEKTVYGFKGRETSLESKENTRIMGNSGDGSISTCPTYWPSPSVLLPLAKPAPIFKPRPKEGDAGSKMPESARPHASNLGQSVEQTPAKLNIVRIRQRQTSPGKSSVNRSGILVPPMSTPRAFFQHLYSQTSPVAATALPDDVNQTQNILHKRSDLVPTNFGEQIRTFPGPQLPFSMLPSSSELSDTSMSSENEGDQGTHGGDYPRPATNVQTASVLASTMQHTLSGISREITVRVDAEEKLANALIDEYRNGGLEVSRDLNRNSTSRLKYDATRLALVLRGQRDSLAKANVQLTGGSPLTGSNHQDSDHISQHAKILSEMLDRVRN